MNDQTSKVQRWLDLVAYLIGRRFPVPVDEIMRRIPAYAERWRTEDETARATARRTFERDKDELRALGITIETVRYSTNYGLDQEEGYRLARRDFYLPELKLVEGATARPRRWSDRHRIEGVELAEDEARAALDALRRIPDLPSSPLAREARSAFRKLAFDLDPDHFLPAPVLYLERPGGEARLRALGMLTDALLARKRAQFDYHGIERGERTARVVAPFGLFFKFGHWYLVGHDEGRDGIRVFRVDRMESVRTNTNSPKTPDFEVPDDFRVADYLERKPWELGTESPPIRAEVYFHYPISLWAARNEYGELLAEYPDGSSLRGFDLYRPEPFLRWLLSLRGEAELRGPGGLVHEFESLIQELMALYDGSGAEVAEGVHDG